MRSPPSTFFTSPNLLFDILALDATTATAVRCFCYSFFVLDLFSCKTFSTNSCAILRRRFSSSKDPLDQVLPYLVHLSLILESGGPTIPSILRVLGTDSPKYSTGLGDRPLQVFFGVYSKGLGDGPPQVVWVLAPVTSTPCINFECNRDEILCTKIYDRLHGDISKVMSSIASRCTEDT
ncbi:hypothetical protein CHS0354_030975 [Potamilus streckersoni]|uniref:Uncharacterized protein n=1 Tax=Potamilus streckersoni TaxID=2493646 RepID=A0AAE0SET4_9BIVA|nr:hypothetical protein CHS0354_030975 [Potamilus streckersoni]